MRKWQRRQRRHERCPIGGAAKKACGSLDGTDGLDGPVHMLKELCVEVEGTRLTVAEELPLEDNPKLLSDAVAGVSGLLEVDGDGAEQPR
jgi:hypothetical protein